MTSPMNSALQQGSTSSKQIIKHLILFYSLFIVLFSSNISFLSFLRQQHLLSIIEIISLYLPVSFLIVNLFLWFEIILLLPTTLMTMMMILIILLNLSIKFIILNTCQLQVFLLSSVDYFWINFVLMRIQLVPLITLLKTLYLTNPKNKLQVLNKWIKFTNFH